MLYLTRKTPVRSGLRHAANLVIRWVVAAVIAGMLLMPGRLNAQAPAGVAGRIEGNDITVEHPAAVVRGQSAGGVWVGNGSIITVHSGQARLSVADDGAIDICGPTKFTFLETGGTITLALEFGRLRVALSTEISLQIYTPFITATPLSIGGGARDFTLGLDLNGTLCVRAAQGAMRLQQQFTGEDLVVPQAGEFFIGAGLLVPNTGTPGSCRCDVTLNRANPSQAPPIPEAGLAAPPVAVPSTQTAHGQESTKSTAAAGSSSIENPMKAAVTENGKAGSAVAKEEARQTVEFSVPASVNQNGSIAPPAKNDAATPAPVDPAIWKVVMPPLTFSADSPYPPADPSPETILLVRESRVQPDWIFSGSVEAPAVALANEKPQPVLIAEKSPAKKPGFWTKLKRFLSGEPAGCEGTGCAD
ncbi:MAG: hypothetical protein WBC04_19015 [Candidatus Acidiferrales bacterium]